MPVVHSEEPEWGKQLDPSLEQSDRGGSGVLVARCPERLDSLELLGLVEMSDVELVVHR
jgi:hypothetical protein